MNRHAVGRAREAWEQRYKHAKAGRQLDQIAREKPKGSEVYKILAEWMYAYEAADAAAELAFNRLAAEAAKESGE